MLRAPFDLEGEGAVSMQDSRTFSSRLNVDTCLDHTARAMRIRFYAGITMVIRWPFFGVGSRQDDQKVD